jgi:hypothetical protein
MIAPMVSLRRELNRDELNRDELNRYQLKRYRPQSGIGPT